MRISYPLEDCCFKTLYLESNLEILIQWVWDGAQEFVLLTSISGDSYHQRSLENTGVICTLHSPVLFPAPSHGPAKYLLHHLAAFVVKPWASIQQLEYNMAILSPRNFFKRSFTTTVFLFWQHELLIAEKRDVHVSAFPFKPGTEFN